VLVVDQTGWVKKSKKSAVMVGPYGGTAGRRENGQYLPPSSESYLICPRGRRGTPEKKPLQSTARSQLHLSQERQSITHQTRDRASNLSSGGESACQDGLGRPKSS